VETTVAATALEPLSIRDTRAMEASAITDTQATAGPDANRKKTMNLDTLPKCMSCNHRVPTKCAK
jgi:hypothetical protein